MHEVIVATCAALQRTKTQLVLVLISGALFVGDETTNPLRIDSNMKLLNPADARDITEFGGGFSGPSSL